MSISKENLVKDYIETHPQLVRCFPQGLLVNVIKNNVTQAIENFGDRKQHISSALQNIGKLKASSVFTLGVKEDAIETYSKYKVDGENKQEIESPNVDGAKQVDDSKVKEDEPTIEQGIDLNELDGAVVDFDEVDSNAPEDANDIDVATIEEVDGEMTAQIVEDEEIRVDKKVKAKAEKAGVDLNIGNTAYKLDGMMVSFVLTKPTITKNKFVDKSYKSGDLFVLETPIKL